MSERQRRLLTIPEGKPYTFDLEDFDVQSGRLTFLTIDSVPGRGRLFYDESPLAGTGCTISAIDILIGNLTYRPESGRAGSDHAVFDYTTISNFKSRHSGCVVFNVVESGNPAARIAETVGR